MTDDIIPVLLCAGGLVLASNIGLSRMVRQSLSPALLQCFFNPSASEIPLLENGPVQAQSKNIPTGLVR